MRTGAKHDGNEQDDGHDEVHVGPDRARDVDGQPVVLVIIVAKCVSLVVRSSVDRLVRHALIGRRHLSEQRPTTAEHRHFGSTADEMNVWQLWSVAKRTLERSPSADSLPTRRRAATAATPRTVNFHPSRDRVQVIE